MGRPAADVGQETSTLVTQAVAVGVDKILSRNRRQYVSWKTLFRVSGSQSAAEFGNGETTTRCKSFCEFIHRIVTRQPRRLGVELVSSPLRYVFPGKRHGNTTTFPAGGGGHWPRWGNTRPFSLPHVCLRNSPDMHNEFKGGNFTLVVTLQ